MKILGTETFTPKFCCTELELQAFKMMEEAAEVHQAVKKLGCIDEVIDEDRRWRDMEEELADYFQAGFNFAAMLGYSDPRQVEDIMHDCYRRNYHRGRYE